MMTTGYVIRTEAGDYSYYGSEDSAQQQHKNLYWLSPSKEYSQEWHWEEGTEPISVHPILESR